MILVSTVVRNKPGYEFRKKWRTNSSVDFLRKRQNTQKFPPGVSIQRRLCPLVLDCFNCCGILLSDH
ncbi:hypothetical protein J4Q44_G00248700 [Coregonus suidteri]|uniref:Uncharacterized protein n=1 Tax=Coregonus suidteri TaxID=861788 RepID=A0AAN8KZP7_9TELE